MFSGLEGKKHAKVFSEKVIMYAAVKMYKDNRQYIFTLNTNIPVKSLYIKIDMLRVTENARETYRLKFV